MQDLTEAVDYQLGMSQIMFAGSLGVSVKIVEVWKNGRNKLPKSSKPSTDKLIDRDVICNSPVARSAEYI